MEYVHEKHDGYCEIKNINQNKIQFTSSLITVALLSDCKADVILRPKSAKTILH